jgi:hypothetical protein
MNDYYDYVPDIVGSWDEIRIVDGLVFRVCIELDEEDELFVALYLLEDTCWDGDAPF